MAFLCSLKYELLSYISEALISSYIDKIFCISRECI